MLRDAARVLLVIRLRLELGGCGGLGGFDGCGLKFGAVGRSGARWRAHWRPSASSLLGFFWTGFGVTFRGGGWLGSGVRFLCRCPGGQAPRAVWRAGLPGCFGCCRWLCLNACGVMTGRVCAGLGLG